MKFTGTILAICALMLTACSKSESGAEAVAEGEGEAAGAATEQAAAADPGAVERIQQQVDQKQYDQAVADVLKAKAAAKTEADALAYRQRLETATQALAEQAKTDPKAREAYNNLGRMTMGR